jgi:hypothetical protein
MVFGAGKSLWYLETWIRFEQVIRFGFFFFFGRMGGRAGAEGERAAWLEEGWQRRLGGEGMGKGRGRERT